MGNNTHKLKIWLKTVTNVTSEKKKEREKQTLFIALTTLLIMGALVCYVLLK